MIYPYPNNCFYFYIFNLDFSQKFFSSYFELSICGFKPIGHYSKPFPKTAGQI